jgi:hypothetical protein
MSKPDTMSNKVNDLPSVSGAVPKANLIIRYRENGKDSHIIKSILCTKSETDFIVDVNRPCEIVYNSSTDAICEFDRLEDGIDLLTNHICDNTGIEGYLETKDNLTFCQHTRTKFAVFCQVIKKNEFLKPNKRYPVVLLSDVISDWEKVWKSVELSKIFFR